MHNPINMVRQTSPTLPSPREVADHYWQHLNELSEYSKFHYLTRLYLICNDTKALSHLNALLTHTADVKTQWSALLHYLKNKDKIIEPYRQEFLDKYPTLRDETSKCFGLLYGKKIWGISFTEEYPTEDLYDETYEMFNKLIHDKQSVINLSTYALNFLYLQNSLHSFVSEEVLLANLYEEYYSHSKIQNCTDSKFTPLKQLYYVTHLVINDSHFYTREIPKAHVELHSDALMGICMSISSNSEEFTLDALCEIVVAYKLIGQTCPIFSQITECMRMLHLAGSPYLTASASPSSINDAEHTNVLYICGWSTS